MADWTIIILLILFGLALIIVEVIFIPGTTFVGVLGFVSMIIGIVVSFSKFGSETGWLTLAGSAVATGALLYVSFRTNTWKRFAINSSIDSKMNEIELLKFSIGMEGVALSALRPIGKGEFDGEVLEVRTNGEYVEAGSKIRIVRVTTNQVLVEIIN
jgi:membrane-bound ClpP family serine protease